MTLFLVLGAIVSAVIALLVIGFSLMVVLEALGGDRLEHLEESELDKT